MGNEHKLSYTAAEIDEKLRKVTTGDLAVIDLGENALSPGESVVIPADVEAALTAAIEANMPFMLKLNADLEGMALPISTVAAIATIGEDVYMASSFGPWGIALGRVDGEWRFNMFDYQNGSGALEEAAAELEGIVNGEY